MKYWGSVIIDSYWFLIINKVLSLVLKQDSLMNKVEKTEFIIYFISIIYMKYKLFVIFFTFLNILSITFDHHVLAEEKNVYIFLNYLSLISEW